ncbi:Holliday junction resolvase RuvX [Epidermidibacterium keratini]|uniref:Holliday junction resolvase RuvX n=1 Tax=Epidermidibacterium keratini TaxID=1891644 RepID=UPI001CEFAB08|nr:Holliday junction resolvase RuvX [Epidermidibacterium keratini]
MSEGWVRGRRLGVDPGAVRVGLAVSDPDGVLATPLDTLARDRKRGTDLDQLAAYAEEYEVIEIVVGRPVGLSGRDGRAAQAADEYAALIEARLPDVPVSRQDERFSTVTAAGRLRGAGLDARAQRGVIDRAAATEILQTWLDAHRARQRPHSEDC